MSENNKTFKTATIMCINNALKYGNVYYLNSFIWIQMERHLIMTRTLLSISILCAIVGLSNVYILSAEELEHNEKVEKPEKILHTPNKTTSNLNTDIDNFTKQILLQLIQNKKNNVAVSEFTDLGGNITDIGKFIADEVISRLILSGKLKVIERKYFSKVLKDHRLPLLKALDPTSAQTLQNLLGIDTIITGTIVDLGTRIKINANLYNSASGTIFGAAFVESQTDDNLRNLIDQQTLEPHEINLKNKIEDLAQQITQSMVDHKKKKLVIMELPDLSGEITNFSKFMYEELISYLMMYKYFDVIEKKLYDNLLNESEGSVYNVTSDISKEIGEKLGADAIAYGTISNLGSSVNVNIRLITPETGVPFSVARAEITSDTTVKRLLEIPERRIMGTQTATSVTAIQDEGEPLQKENVIKSKTKVSKLKRSKRMFFDENFSRYPVGETLTKWGEGIIVIESLGKKGITSKISGENTITQEVNFPDDFNFSFDIKGTSWTWSNFSFYNSKGDRFKMDLRIKDNHFCVNFPNKAEAKVSCNAEEYNRVSIVKKGNNCQVYLNNTFIINNLFENKTRFTNFSLNCRLDTISLTNFSGIEL